MAGPSPKDEKRGQDGGERKPESRNDKPAEQLEPLDEESLEKVMRETPL